MKRFVALTIGLCLIAGLANAQTLTGSWPEGGGAISVTASGGDVNAAGLDFASPGANLIPAEGTDASPFTFFLSNTATQVTYGNLGSAVTFADGSTTALSVGAKAGATDITASWGDGPMPVDFEVTEMITVTPNPSVTWSPAIVAGTTVGDIIGGLVIPFTAAEYPGSTSDTATFFSDNGDTGNADLNMVLDSHGWNSEGATLLVEGLTSGNDYQIQLLMGDSRECCLDRLQTASDGTNVSEAFSRNGGSVIGSFTATGGSLSLGIAGETDPGLSGFILYNSTTGSLAQAINFTSDGVGPTVSIPEPAGVSLLIFGLLGALGLRRRR